MQRTLGGASRIAAVRDYEEMVVAETFSATGEERARVRKRVRWIAPNYLRIDQVGPGSTYVLFFDGVSGWEIMPDRASADKTKGGAVALVDAELEFAKGYVPACYSKCGSQTGRLASRFRLRAKMSFESLMTSAKASISLLIL
jgi:hypothetical protein